MRRCSCDQFIVPRHLKSNQLFLLEIIYCILVRNSNYFYEAGNRIATFAIQQSQHSYRINDPAFTTRKCSAPNAATLKPKMYRVNWSGREELALLPERAVISATYAHATLEYVAGKRSTFKRKKADAFAIDCKITALTILI